MIDTYALEQDLSDKLDDLLVENNHMTPRQTRIIGGGRGMGFMLRVKDKPRINFKLEIYPNETEEPHFKVVYQNVTCRFTISDCEPMKAEAKNGIPTQIKKIMKEIKTVWANNREDIVRAWVESRPTNQNHGHQHIR